MYVCGMHVNRLQKSQLTASDLFIKNHETIVSKCQMFHTKNVLISSILAKRLLMALQCAMAQMIHGTTEVNFYHLPSVNHAKGCTYRTFSRCVFFLL